MRYVFVILLLATAAAAQCTQPFISTSSLSSCPVGNNGPGNLPSIISATNPSTGNDPNDRRLVDFTGTTDSTTSNPNFSDENVFQITENVVNGQNMYGNGTNAKKTFLPLSITGNMQGAGQRQLFAEVQNCYGMGDCSAESKFVNFAGGPIAGDEGQSFQVVSLLQQQPHLNLTASTSSATRTACNTTLTQSVTASRTAQTVTVASTTGCNTNDWLVVGQEQPTGTPNESLMQITGVGGGTLTGVIIGNYANGTTLTPAVVINTAGDGSPWGQDRVVVDLSSTPYTTGTVASIAGGGFTGSGTGWSTGMVGGGSTIVGCIALTNDDYNGTPFNSTGENGNLKSWYQIQASGLTATQLGIFTYSTAGDGAYHGKGVGSGAYTIRPCAKVLKVNSNSTQIILETNSFTWTNGDSLEEIVTPYPDMTGLQYHMADWTPGGAPRGFMDVRNVGARTFTYGINIAANMATGGNADTLGWGVGLQVANAGTGVAITQPTSLAIGIGTNNVNQTGRISWGTLGNGPYIGINATSINLEIATTAASTVPNGVGSLVFANPDPITSEAMTRGNFIGHWDVSNFNNSIEARVGLFGTSGNTWFFRTRAPSDRVLDIFNNNNGGGEGNGVGIVATFDGSTTRTNFNGPVTIKPLTFSGLPTCSGTTEGMQSPITDSTTNTWGATITGSGTNHVSAYCDGTNWTVAAK